MNDTLDLIRDRLQRIEEQNDAQLALLHKHLDDDAAVAKTVAGHATLFRLLGGALTAAAGTLLVKLGWK